MSDLLSASKYLEEKGLLVDQCSSIHFRLKKTDDAVLELRSSDSQFDLSRWDYVPGPGNEDFKMSIDTLDEATLVIWNYFFGVSVIINDWNVCMHRYPYWSLAQMQYRLANLVHVAQDQFQALEETRSNRFFQTLQKSQSRFDIAKKTQFIHCGDHLITGEKLMVRRDMQEAYAIHLK